MAHTACGRIEPHLLVDVIGNGKGLESPLGKGGQEVIDVLASQYMLDLVLLCPLGACLGDHAFGEIGTVLELSDHQVTGLGCELGFWQIQHYRAAWQGHGGT